MGSVYQATQLSLNRVVALKLLAANLGDDPGFRARFEREGQVQAALDHDHIVPVYEAGQSEYGLFLAMRLIAGPTLKHLILDDALEDSAREAAWISSAACAGRDHGSLAIPWAITPSSAGGRSGRRSLSTGGGCITWAWRVAASEGFGYGTSPVRHS